jgi:hypothetical protein
MSEICGIFNGPVAGTTVPLAVAPATVGITIGTVIKNESNGITGAVTAVNAASVEVDVSFAPGEFYTITLPTAWQAQNDDGLVIDVECRVCGFSFPATELVDDTCSVCLDKDD